MRTGTYVRVGSHRTPVLSRSNRTNLVVNTMFRRPYATVSQLVSEIGSTFPTINGVVNDLCREGVLVEVTGNRRDRVFAFRPYLDILHRAVGDLGTVVGGADPLATHFER